MAVAINRSTPARTARAPATASVEANANTATISTNKPMEKVEAIKPPKDPLPVEADSVHVNQFSFIVYGDTRGRRDGKEVQYEHSLIVDSMLANIKKLSVTPYPVRFVLQTGDAVVNGRDPKQWNKSFVALINRITTEGRVPYFLAPGNHDVTAAQDDGRLDVREWAEAHLRDGVFDHNRTLDLIDGIRRGSARDGFPRTRFVTHMEWALENRSDVERLLQYEASANLVPLEDPVVCAYDLTRFGADVVIDVMRTHPLIIIGGILQENPFFVPPDEFIGELRARRGRDR